MSRYGSLVDHINDKLAERYLPNDAYVEACRVYRHLLSGNPERLALFALAFDSYVKTEGKDNV